MTLGLILTLLAALARAADPKDASPIRLLDTKVPAAAQKPWEPMKGRSFQPEDYIPGESKAPADECIAVHEDGWNRNGDAAVTLPKPYTLRSTMFSCGGSDAVVEVRKDGARHALYQYVQGFSVASDGRTLFLSNDRALGKGGREGFVGLVDIPTKKKTPLPRLDCVPRIETSAIKKAWFEGERLLTIADANEEKAGDKGTEVCVWGTDGRLVSRLSARLQWVAMDVYVMTDAVGLLPAQPDVFYAYSRLGGEDCRVWLQHLKEPRAASAALGVKPQTYPGDEVACPPLELDLSAARLEGGTVRWRRPPAKPGEKEAPWQTAAVAAAP